MEEIGKRWPGGLLQGLGEQRLGLVMRQRSDNAIRVGMERRAIVPMFRRLRSLTRADHRIGWLNPARVAEILLPTRLTEWPDMAAYDPRFV